MSEKRSANTPPQRSREEQVHDAGVERHGPAWFEAMNMAAVSANGNGLRAEQNKEAITTIVLRVLDVAKRIYSPQALASEIEAFNVPDGWKLVPIEPTEEMLAAAEREWDGRMSARSAGVWKVMCTAVAPQTTRADVTQQQAPPSATASAIRERDGAGNPVVECPECNIRFDPRWRELNAAPQVTPSACHSDAGSAQGGSATIHASQSAAAIPSGYHFTAAPPESFGDTMRAKGYAEAPSKRELPADKDYEAERARLRAVLRNDLTEYFTEFERAGYLPEDGADAVLEIIDASLQAARNTPSATRELEQLRTDLQAARDNADYWRRKYHEEKPMKITVNGTPHQFDSTGLNGSRISYEAVVKLAGHDPQRTLTVVYSGPRNGDTHRSGTLCKGDITPVEDGMHFTVADTSSA